MRILIFALVLILNEPGFAEHGPTNPQGRPIEDVGGADQEKRVIDALKVLFRDPATGKTMTSKYKVYLRYQYNRLAIVKLMIDAETEQKRRILALKLTRLDQDFRPFNQEVIRAKAILWAAEHRLYKDPSAMERVKSQDKKAYEVWQKERKELLDELEKETSDQKKSLLAQKINLLDHTFKIRFIGFLLGLPPQEIPSE